MRIKVNGPATRRLSVLTRRSTGALVALALVAVVMVVCAFVVAMLVLGAVLGERGLRNEYAVDVVQGADGVITVTLVACPDERVQVVRIYDENADRTYWRAVARGEARRRRTFVISGAEGVEGFEVEGEDGPWPDHELLIDVELDDGFLVLGAQDLSAMRPSVRYRDSEPASEPAEPIDGC